MHGPAGSQSLADSLPSNRVIVHAVTIQGHHKTKERIIRREVDFSPGDTIRRQDLPERLAWNQRKITNTNLFLSVEVTTKEVAPQQIDIEVEVKERWYLFAFPVVELADRNFNEWWYVRGRSLRRLIYGARLSYKNVTGNADRLSAVVEFGFARRAQVLYSIPYIDRAQKTGIGVGVSYQTNNNLVYRSYSDTLVYLYSDKQLRSRFFTSVVLTRRNLFYNFHRLELRYARNSIADTIARLNPDYLLEGRTRQRFFQLSYSFLRDRRDVISYPLRGYWFTATATQYGLFAGDDVHLFEATASYSHYWPLGKRFYAGSSLRGKVSMPNSQPYLQFRGLGYTQDFVRGYELYVVDGQQYGLLKNTLRYQLINTRKQFNWIPSKQFNTVPFALYLNVFGDVGYVKSTLAEEYQSRLANKWLAGGGIGFDVVTFYNIVLGLSYSINRQGQTGVYFSVAHDL